MVHHAPLRNINFPTSVALIAYTHKRREVGRKRKEMSAPDYKMNLQIEKFTLSYDLHNIEAFHNYKTKYLRHSTYALYS